MKRHGTLNPKYLQQAIKAYQAELKNETGILLQEVKQKAKCIK